jgi:biopolymer transport protein ExbD
MINIKTKQTRMSEISIAPLVDCVFLLLIFFLLTSTFTGKRGIKIDLPGAASAEERRDKTFDIAMSDAGEIMFQGEPVRITELTLALKMGVREQGKMPVFVLADRLVPLERLTEVIDCVRAAELDSVSIATQKKEPEQQ